jgi:toxin secretion/phage lysis holin
VNKVGAKVNGIFAIACTVLTYLFGGWDVALIVLISFMVIDYITGVSVAVISKTLNSETGARGLLKKLSIILMLIVGVLMDRLINDGTWVFRTLVAYFYIANEGISIIENLSMLGVPVPQKIKHILEQLQSENDSDK